MFDRLLGRQGQSIPTISPRDAWQRYSSAPKDAILIDVREAWEFARGHAKGARNIPLSALTSRLNEISASKHALLICQSGHRSLQAAKILAAHGYERVTNISGGTTVWRMSQLPME